MRARRTVFAVVLAVAFLLAPVVPEVVITPCPGFRAYYSGVECFAIVRSLVHMSPSLALAGLFSPVPPYSPGSYFIDGLIFSPGEGCLISVQFGQIDAVVCP